MAAEPAGILSGGEVELSSRDFVPVARVWLLVPYYRDKSGMIGVRAIRSFENMQAG
jgi:hypothetical protein